MSWIFEAIGFTTDWITTRMTVGKKIEQYIGEAALSAFVSFNAQDERALTSSLERMDGGIGAYINMMNPACIYSVMWNQIHAHPALLQYFSQRVDYREWEQWYKTVTAPEMAWSGMRAWVEAVDLMPLWNPVDAIISLFTTQPIVVEMAKWKAFKTLMGIMPVYPDAIVNMINNYMKPTLTDPARTYAPYSVWLMKNPALWNDWAAISAGIIAHYAYQQAWAAEQALANAPPYITGQRVHVEVGTTYPHVYHLDSKGEAVLDIPLPTGLNAVTINTYGLKRIIQRVVALQLRFFNTSKNFEVSFADPSQVHEEKVSETETVYYIEDLPPAYWGGGEPDYDDYRVYLKQVGTHWIVEIWAGDVEDAGRFTWRDVTIYERPAVYHALPFEKVYSGELQ